MSKDKVPNQKKEPNEMTELDNVIDSNTAHQKTIISEDISSEESASEVFDTDTIDQQWAALSQDWQAQPVAKTDIQALLKQTKRRTWWAKTCFSLNVLATIGLFVAFIVGVMNDEFGTHFNTYLGFGGLFSLIFVYYESKIRANAWRQISDSPDKAIENAITGCQSSMKYMSLTKWSCLPFGALANWLVYSVSQTENKSILGAFIFINAFITVMFLITEWLHRKRKKEYQQLMALTSNLSQ